LCFFAAAEEGGTAPAPQVYDLVLQAVGRTPNGKKIAAEKAGVAITDRGFINVDFQMRTNVPHKAVHEAHVAAEVIAGELQGNKEVAAAAFNARDIPSVAYSAPEVAWRRRLHAAVALMCRRRASDADRRPNCPKKRYKFSSLLRIFGKGYSAIWLIDSFKSPNACGFP
jgi:pyruvate/2-oxoglutarate dehydrogenase complex dihydrolipoamide acyltransferase (E2) component